MDGARLLEEKCREFSVEGSVVQIHPGPVVTTFEFKPDAGVKYSKITGLADDLCLAMQAESVLIDRIPGQVHRRHPDSERARAKASPCANCSSRRSTARSTSKLTIALGKTIHGEPYVADLATMPHLLIAGSTGAGKSVGMNVMLTSILYRATPDDVRMIMIDPKRLELGMYEDIPHLLTPVVVDPKQAANALRWAVREMEERYKTLAAVGVRNIEQFNRNTAGGHRGQGDDAQRRRTEDAALHRRRHRRARRPDDGRQQRSRGIDRAPRADGARRRHPPDSRDAASVGGRHHRPHQGEHAVAHFVPRAVEDRLADHSRRATARSSSSGAATCSSCRRPRRASSALHGPYISEQESARLASFLRKQGKPTYDETITAEEKTAGLDGIEIEKDDLYDEAARIVVSSGQASISYLQRRLRIGFSRAARLVDMMEMEGLVSAAAGGKPREVLVDKGYFEEVDAQLR